MNFQLFGIILLLALLGFVGQHLYRGFQKGWGKGAADPLPSGPALPRIYLARYLTGFPDHNQPLEPVYCLVAAADFIFQYGSGAYAREIFRLPRHALAAALVDDKTVIAQRLTTVTRLAFFGPFALALPKKKKADSFWLDLEWRDLPEGVSRHAIFEFDGLQCDGYARLAANELLKHALSPPAGPGPDDKTCPHCAEIIKKDARLCRFCRSPLD